MTTNTSSRCTSMHPPFMKWSIATAVLVGLMTAPGLTSAQPTLLPSFFEGVATVPNPAKLQLSCGGEMPSLLGSEAQTKENLQAYYSYYRRRQRRLRAAEKDGVVFIPLDGDAKFRVLSATGMNGNMVYADGWNATHAMPSHTGVKSATPSSTDPLAEDPSSSSSSSSGGSSGSDATGVEMGGALVWAAPPPSRALMDSDGRSAVLPCERRIGKGRLLVVANWFPGNFGHFLHDTLPLLLWLQNHHHPGVHPEDRFGLVDDWLHRTVLRWLDPRFADRIVWLPLGTVNCVQGLVAVQYATRPASPPPLASSSSAVAATTTTASVPKLQRREKHTSVWELRNPSLFRNLALALEVLRPASTNYVTPTHLRPQPTALPLPPRRLSSDSSDSSSNHEEDSELNDTSSQRQMRALKAAETTSSSTSGSSSSNGLIIFYSRRSSRTQHGRIMSEAHEAACLQIIRAAMSKFQRPEALVVFNGQDADGRKMSYENQFRTFRSAKLVLGPHGSGLANVLWMRPTDGKACANAPAVLEFIADDDTSRAGVQPGSSGKSYFSLLGGVPWVRYYHLFLAHNSTNSALFVDLHQLEHALDVVFTRMPLANPPQLPPPAFSATVSSSSLSSSSSSTAASSASNAGAKTATTTTTPSQGAASSSSSPSSISQAQLALEAALAADAAATEGIDLNQWSLTGPWPESVGIGGGLGGFVFVLATHKTGSTFLWKLFRGLAMRTQSCLLDGEKSPLPEDSASLLKLCPGGGGVLFTRKLVAPATAAKIASAMREASASSAAVKRQKLQAATAAPTTVAEVESSSSSSLSFLAPPKVRCVVQTRNPYDVIVSQYQSFTLNHALPPEASLEARNKELAKRKAEREAGPDTYALKHWSEIKGRLDASRAVGRTFTAQGAEVLFSQYEDMTARPEAWASYLEKFLGLSENGDGNGSGSSGSSIGGGTGAGGGGEEQRGGENSSRGGEVEEVRLRSLRQRAWLKALALEQRTVVPSETSHTAYFMPGAHLKLLRNTTLSWLY